MVRVRVDEKYGVVIPRKVMEELGIEKGDVVEFVKNERGEFVIRKVERKYEKVLLSAVGSLRAEKRLKDIQKAFGESFDV